MKYSLLFTILIIFFNYSCKDRANLVKIENQEKLGQNSEHLIDDSEKLVELSDLILTGKHISGLLVKYSSISDKFDFTVKFLNDRNESLYKELSETAKELEITILEIPSEKMIPEIEKFEGVSDESVIIDKYKNWIKTYSTDIERIATWMIQSSDNKEIIDLGAKVNSYSYALKREMSNLDKIS